MQDEWAEARQRAKEDALFRKTRIEDSKRVEKRDGKTGEVIVHLYTYKFEDGRVAHDVCDWRLEGGEWTPHISHIFD